MSLGFVLSSLSFMNSTPPYNKYSGSVENLFDMKTFTRFRPIHEEGTFIEFEFENEARVPFNYYGYIGGNDIQFIGYHLEGQIGNTERWIELDRQSGFNITDRYLTILPLQEGLTGWKRLRFVIDEPSVWVLKLSEFILGYQTPDITSLCESMDGYIAVSSDQYSYKRCPKGYSGYMLRQCVDGQWDEEISECEMNNLTYIHYPKPFYNLTVGLFFQIDAEVDGIPTRVYSIPAGLQIATNGTIYGIVNQEGSVIYTIVAENDITTVNTTVSFTFYTTFCDDLALSLHIPVGEKVALPCSMYIKNSVGRYYLLCKPFSSTQGIFVPDDNGCFSIGVFLGFILVIACCVVFGLLFVVKKLKKKQVDQPFHQLNNRV